MLSVVLAFVSNYDKSQSFEYAQLVIRISIILEAFATLPQLRVMKNERFVSKFLGYYLVMLGLSRIARIFFWVLQVKATYG